MSEEKNDDVILSEQDCGAVLSKALTRSNWKYKSFVADRLTSVDGLLGTHYKVTIHYYDDDVSEKSERFFLKVLSSSMSVVFEMSLSLNAYEKEQLLYEVLMKQFRDEGLDVSYAPACHFCRPYLILLEDLSLNGYRNTPKKDMLDVEHCKVGLKALAQFHASAIAYEEIKSKEQRFRLIDSHSDYLGEKLFAETENVASLWLKCTLQGLVQIINLLPESKDVSNRDFQEKLLEELDSCYENSKPSDKYRNTLLHGDLWSNNFMFKYENGKPIHSILIDYQLLKYGVPALDVVQMIVTNVRRSLRLEFHDELLESYYESFAEYLRRHGLDTDEILSRDDFLKSCHEVRFLAKLQASADHSVTFLMDEVLIEAFKSDESLETFLFKDRTNSITTSFRTDDLYREILQEDLLELRDLLFSK